MEELQNQINALKAELQSFKDEYNYNRFSGLEIKNRKIKFNTNVGFFRKSPIAQQTTTSQTAATFAANSSGITNDTATWNGYTIGDLVAILQAFGLIA